MRQISLQLWLSHDLSCALKVSLQQHELQTTHYCSLLTLLTPIFFLNVETGEQMSSWTLHFPYQGVEWYDILWDVPHLKETENFPVPCINVLCPLLICFWQHPYNPVSVMVCCKPHHCSVKDPLLGYGFFTWISSVDKLKSFAFLCFTWLLCWLLRAIFEKESLFLSSEEQMSFWKNTEHRFMLFFNPFCSPERLMYYS